MFLNRMVIFPIIFPYGSEIALKSHSSFFWNESKFASVKMLTPCNWKKGIKEKGKSPKAEEKTWWRTAAERVNSKFICREFYLWHFMQFDVTKHRTKTQTWLFTFRQFKQTLKRNWFSFTFKNFTLREGLSRMHMVFFGLLKAKSIKHKTQFL